MFLSFPCLLSSSEKNIFPSQNIFLLFLLRSLLPRGMISNFALFNSENLSFLQMQCKSQNMISLGWEVTIFLHTTIKRKAFPLPTFLFLSGNYIKQMIFCESPRCVDLNYLPFAKEAGKPRKPGTFCCCSDNSITAINNPQDRISIHTFW